LIVIEASEKAMWCKQIISVILVSFTSLRWQAKASYKCKNYRQFFICGKLHLPKTKCFSFSIKIESNYFLVLGASK
jgi:hypothetical protein